MQVEHADVVAAYHAALASRGSSTPPAEGAVGSGTGMSCFDFKGGIGTSSRVTAEGHTVAVLLMTNFGVRGECVVAGVPVGRMLPPSTSGPHAPAGSCIGIVVTDAPVDGASCARLARRVGLGLARSGSVAHHGSGEIFMAFGTGLRTDRNGRHECGDLVTGPRPRPALHRRRRGHRGGRAELHVHRPDGGRAGRQHQRVDPHARGAGPARGVRGS
ncbi:MAG: P1 family peptidase [Nocardioides sp.]